MNNYTANWFMANVGPASARARMDMLLSIQLAGLLTGLKLVLDAGDHESYPGSGGKWLDVAGGGYDFFVGATTGAESTDPAYSGVVGARSANEYFSTDGGDYLLYDSALETWMNNIAKSAGVVTVVSAVFLNSLSYASLMSTSGAGQPAVRGFDFAYFDTSKKFVYFFITSGAAITSFGGGNPDISAEIPGNFIAMISATLTNGASYNVRTNDVAGSGSIGAIPTSSNSTASMRALATGNAAGFAPSGTRAYMYAIWEGTKLTPEQMAALFSNYRGKLSK